MEPKHQRLDPVAYVVAALDKAVGHPVVSTTDATLDPTLEPVTVAQVTSNAPAGRLTRWQFQVSVTLITYAGNPVTAFQAHSEVADSMLELTTLEDGDVLVSSTVCVQEPEDVPVRAATDWPGQLSSYTTFLRRKAPLA